MDDEYQKQRREALAKRPTDFKEGFARGGKGLIMVSKFRSGLKKMLRVEN